MTAPNDERSVRIFEFPARSGPDFNLVCGQFEDSVVFQGKRALDSTDPGTGSGTAASRRFMIVMMSMLQEQGDDTEREEQEKDDLDDPGSGLGPFGERRKAGDDRTGQK